MSDRSRPLYRQSAIEDAARCQHCPNLADERSYMCEDCASRADAEVQELRDERLTHAERERVLWWLHRPVPPGPMKDLDEAIIRKLSTGGDGR